jgi:thermitase
MKLKRGGQGFRKLFTIQRKKIGEKNMKTIKRIKVTVFVFLFCIFYAVFLGTIGTLMAQDSEPDYYIVDGKKIVLQPSQYYSAIQLKPGTSAAELNTFKSDVVSAGFGTVEDSPILQKHNLVLVRIKAGIEPTSFRVGTEDLKKKQVERVESENPVYEVGGIDQVLVNEFIVQFKSQASKEEIAQSLEKKNAEIVEADNKITNMYTIKFTGKSAKEALAISNEYYNDPLVEFIEPNFIRVYPPRPMIKSEEIKAAGPAPAATPSDTYYSKQWYLNNTGSSGVADADVDAPEAWAIHKGSAEIIVAIIDEGVDTNHKDLKDKIVTPYDATDGDDNQEPNSWDGHGTACAGIAAAMTNNGIGIAGIGWNVKIMPVRIAYKNRIDGDWITTNAIVGDGIYTAVNRGAHVLSNSWGGGSPSELINSAIDYAVDNNRVVVFAAGNCCKLADPDLCPSWYKCYQPVTYPANLSTSKVIIAVSATNQWDEFKTPYSSDKETWWGSNFGPEVNVSAPGVRMWTTDISGTGGYTDGDYLSYFCGTSSSTPLVAGIAALLLSQNPGWTPAQVRDRLQSTADDKGKPGFDETFGYGRVNACRALGGNCAPSPGTCSTIAYVSQHQPSDWSIGQTLVNAALLFSTVLLFLLFLVIRRVKRRAV